MKIAIIGYSGSGKSTLTRKLAEHYKVEALHLDSVHFLPGWIERENADKVIILKNQRQLNRFIRDLV
jgi:adenylate kinase family enzyme